MMNNNSSVPFFEHSSRLLQHLGKYSFYGEIAKFLSVLAQSESDRVSCYYNGKSADFLINTFITQEVSELYNQTSSEHDSFLDITRSPMTGDVVIMSNIGDREYSSIYLGNSEEYEKAPVVEVTLMMESAGLTIMYTLSNSNRVFNDNNISSLCDALPFILELHRQHFNLFESYTKASFAATYTDDNSINISPENKLTSVIYSFSEMNQITAREREIIHFVLQGYPNSLIANKLSLSLGTIKNHRHRLYYKLDITSERELFAMFLSYLLKITFTNREQLPY